MITRGKNVFEGANGLHSLALFEERKEYKDFILIPQSIDLWYRNYLYGKVDKKRIPHSLSESNLKQLIADKTIFVVDFVADAFKDMRNYYSQAILQKRVSSQNTIIKDMEPQKGWISSNEIFHVHMNFLYNSFVIIHLIGHKKEQNILNFEDFLNEFILFAQTQNRVPFTKTGFMLSNFCSTLVSGIAIELNVDKNYDDDRIKQKFIEDPNFPFYQKALRKYGFLIDKNVPWRIYANLNSERMRKYAKKYGLSNGITFIQDFFDSYFYDLTLQDIDILKTYLIHFYNSYIVAYPNVKKKSCMGKTTMFKTSKRSPIEQYNKEDVLFWFKYYTLLRFLESEKKFEEAEKFNIIKRSMEMRFYLGEDKALEYINKIIA